MEDESRGNFLPLPPLSLSASLIFKLSDEDENANPEIGQIETDHPREI